VPIVRKRPLSSTARDLLIEHLDGQVVPFKRVGRLGGIKAYRLAVRNRVIKALVENGCLRWNRTVRPTCTQLTAKGRSELADLLAEYADVLMRAQYGKQALSADGDPPCETNHLV